MKGLPYFFNYDNFSKQASNTCGQAVIASLLDFLDKNPFELSRDFHSPIDDRHHYAPDEVLTKVVERFGPNWPIKGGMTVRKQIKRALTAFGIEFTEIKHPFLTPPKEAINRLICHVSSQQMPAIVLLDAHQLDKKASRFTLHWAIVYAFDTRHVHIATWGKNIAVTWQTFIKSWRCKWITYPYNYYQIQVKG